MGNAYPASGDRKHCSESISVRGDENVGFDAGTDTDQESLLEENARLKALVVKLSGIVLRNVVDQK